MARKTVHWLRILVKMERTKFESLVPMYFTWVKMGQKLLFMPIIPELGTETSES